MESLQSGEASIGYDFNSIDLTNKAALMANASNQSISQKQNPYHHHSVDGRAKGNELNELQTHTSTTYKTTA